MTGLPLDGLLSVQDVAVFLGVSKKTVFRMIARGDLPVTHRIGHSIRVDASSVTSLLAGSATSTAVETIAMNNDNNDGGASGAPRLFRQRGKSKVWTALINNQEVPLGTNDEKEARRRLAELYTEGDLKEETPWRVYWDAGWVVKYYDTERRRRTHRLVRSLPTDATKAHAEDAAAAWYEEHVSRRMVKRSSSAPRGPVRRATGTDSVPTFRQFGEDWTSGALSRRFPDHVREKASRKDDATRLKLYVYPVIGDRPMSEFEGRAGIELVEKVVASLPPVSTTFSRSSRRHVLQVVSRLLNLAAYPGKYIAINPLPKGFLPKVAAQKAKSFLYPSEEAQLMACREVPVVARLFYGVLAREGFRVSEALALTWKSVDLDRGVVTLEENKTDDPRSWVLDPGVVEALRRWRDGLTRLPKPTTLLFADPKGRPLDRFVVASALRDYLTLAGVNRPQLFERTETRIPLRAHDLRATFVTINLALGKTEAWITDRTGHRSSQMIYTYKRGARSVAELQLGSLVPLHEAIPELAKQAK